MTKFGAVDFDDCILDALRDDRLVVFAGAGVSIGEPSCLIGFDDLARGISEGTGLSPSQPLDRFLGRLHHLGIPVHHRAAKMLSPPGSAPTLLHKDLLRLFRTVDRVRLVTTNFDLHFESAASYVFGASPDVFCAPALPRGYDFNGIVHIHGALPRNRDLVLTDADFGRAYLTEGWARRFLVDLFRRYTVLFVGYSHDDVVMTYLARALPADDIVGRFALTDEDGSWDLLGIKPIRFSKVSGENPFEGLYDGIRLLAERTTRGALDWQSRLAELGSGSPPEDQDAVDEIKQALREVYTTRLLLNVAKDPKWLIWLNERKYLDMLFSDGQLGERDMMLADWLAKNFSVDYAEDVFAIFATHGLRMNPALWSFLGMEIGAKKDRSIEVTLLMRWASLLIATMPESEECSVLVWLAERCANHACTEMTLAIFVKMAECRLNIKPGFILFGGNSNESRQLDVECSLRADHWSLNEVWESYLKPNIKQVAQPLLSAVTRQLEKMHDELVVWQKASRERDILSFRRSAIEPHEQDQYPEAIDVLIDAARDSLEWLAESSSMLLSAWVERLISSDVPLLRRLSVHAITVHPGLSSDERLEWLLGRLGLHELPEHHEIYRAVALNYVAAREVTQKLVVNAILERELPAYDGASAKERTLRLQFDWLSWLLQVKPDCELAKMALTPVKAEFPAWRPSDHPDFTHWMGTADWVGYESPWTVDQLLQRSPAVQLDELLGFEGVGLDGPSREGLIGNIRGACKQNNAWAFLLGNALSEQAQWSSDIWSALIHGLQESQLSRDGWYDLLTLVSEPALWSAHAYEVARLLFTLVRDGGTPFTLDLLEQANAIALSLWNALLPDYQDDDIDDWLTRAINRPAGVIVEFWMNGLSLLLRDKTGVERIIPESYLNWFALVVNDTTSKGGLGRSVLASQTAFLFSLDERWTSRHINPMFNDADSKRFSQAWDGFLTWGRLNPALAEALLPSFVAAMPRIFEMDGRRRRFMEFYTALATFHVVDPTQQLLPALFQNGSLEDRLSFASHIGYFLRNMQNDAKQQLWRNWLFRYWKDRLDGIFALLHEEELQIMLEWLPHLGDAFSDAVRLAVNHPPISISYSRILYALRDSELVSKFPVETAELLIYLAGCFTAHHGDGLSKVRARMPVIPESVRGRLDEAFVRAGILH